METRNVARAFCIIAIIAISAVGCTVDGTDTTPFEDENDGPAVTGEAASGVGGDFCYGAHGAHCEGIPGWSTLQPISIGGDLVTVPVSVGSQYHDQCCARVLAVGGRGYMCNGGNTETWTCKPEWERGAGDQAFGYVWRATFNRTAFRPYSTSAPLAGIRAPSGTKIAVNDARAGWCQNGFYLINFGLQAKCR
jgi:hypothetical protein